MIDALAIDRAPFPEFKDAMKQDLARRAGEAIALIEKYSRGNPGYGVRRDLKRIRDERLAHRDMRAVATAGPSTKDEEIEAFYSDNSEIVRLLFDVVKAVTFDPADAGEAYQVYANHFSASVRGERTEGHPNYRKPFSPAVASSTEQK